ncbi:MAG: long-chain fatty acid--CoA ligase [Saprospiraceae bacterium]|nr:long-chain fatty acid--CoA ligase [Saprospiraceae bacterium]
MDPTRLFDFIKYQIDHYPQDKCIGEIVEGQTRYLSIHEVEAQSNQIARGMQALGLASGDRVAMVMYRNRPEFVLLDLAMQKAGLVSVPMYPTISAKDYEYILNDCQAKAIFFGTGDLEQKINHARSSCPALAHCYRLDEADSTHPLWTELWKDQAADDLDTSQIQPEDLATIIYTSGTTGDPKGVMLSHRNIVENVKSVNNVTPLKPGDRVLSFLPLCHIFERSASMSYIYGGYEVTFAGLDNLGGEDGDLRKIAPHFMTCVPRLLEKIYESIYAKGMALTGAKKKLFFWALALTEDYAFDKTYGGLAQIKRSIADKLIFSKWREALGGNLRGILSGSAPLSHRIAQVFSAAGIPIREGYGLTESSPGITIGRYEPNQALLGTVGPTLDGVEVRIDDADGDYAADEGEILASGPNIMIGYYNKPEETAQTLVEIDGKTWLRTGDIGKMVSGPGGLQYLKITDRKKELLKTSAGKYVAPAPIENKLKEHILIENAMLIGDRRKFVSALIVVSENAVRTLCQEELNVSATALSELIELPAVKEKYQAVIDDINASLARHEQIKRFSLLDQIWEPIKADGSTGELTPTLKLKRRIILSKFAGQIDLLYTG